MVSCGDRASEGHNGGLNWWGLECGGYGESGQGQMANAVVLLA
jgi:hypothetical protein